MSGSGKTTVALGLLAALKARGVAVQPFKVGPDFIDPGLHQIAAGAPSHNLDGWLLSREKNEWLFSQVCVGKDVAIVEGVMGLFDGYDGKSDTGSTAEIARWLGLAVILVIDAYALGRSAAAVIHGLSTFDPRIRIAGVIFNRVAGPEHFQILADAVSGIPILGWLPPEPSIEIPERHLGLMTAQEGLPRARLRDIAAFVEKYLDIDAWLRAMPAVDAPALSSSIGPVSDNVTKRVAIAHDAAFSFYYHANRLLLEQCGAEIIEFSPLHDKEMPTADMLYIGGGYPELYRDELSVNHTMLTSIRSHIELGKTCYAECGGLMYLAQAIDDVSMAGVIPTRVVVTPGLVDFGYCDVTTREASILGPEETRAKGHQFHFSKTTIPSANPLYLVRQRTKQYTEGFGWRNGVASYVHLHFLSNLSIVRNMLHS
jgi:cobyrinic acid a,c-diamide synthase